MPSQNKNLFLHHVLSYLMTSFVALVCFLGCQSRQEDRVESQNETVEPHLQTNSGSEISVGMLAPEIKLEHVFGGPNAEELTLANLKGKVVVLDYWATW